MAPAIFKKAFAAASSSSDKNKTPSTSAPNSTPGTPPRSSSPVPSSVSSSPRASMHVGSTSISNSVTSPLPSSAEDPTVMQDHASNPPLSKSATSPSSDPAKSDQSHAFNSPRGRSQKKSLSTDPAADPAQSTSRANQQQAGHPTSGGAGAAQSAGLFGLLKALAKGSDEPLSGDETEDEEEVDIGGPDGALAGGGADGKKRRMSRGIHRMMSPTGLGRWRSRHGNGDKQQEGGRSGSPMRDSLAASETPPPLSDASRSSTPNPLKEPGAEADLDDEKPGGAGTDTPAPMPRAKSHEQLEVPSGVVNGEWVGAIREAPPDPLSEVDKKKQETKVLIPTFYRTPSRDQEDLSHRLAILSVNNFSGMNLENLDDAPRPVDMPSARQRAKSLGKERDTGSVGISAEERAVDKDRLVEEKQKEILQSLKVDDIDSLKSKLVPESILQASAPGTPGPMVHGIENENGIMESLAPLAKPVAGTRGSASSRKSSGLSQVQTAEDVEAEAEGESSSATSGAETKFDGSEEGEVWGEPAMCKQEKVAAIIEEFGDLAGLMENSEPEQMVSETRGALFRGIVIIGNIHLTTHRITFHAMLPPPNSPETGTHSSIIHSGPVTIHHKLSVFGPKTHRVWMELGPDMVTTYPNASEDGRVRPIRSVLLSSVKQLYPLDPAHPFEIRARYAVPRGEDTLVMTVDTQESALHWHRDLEAALWQHGRARRYHRRMADRAKKAEEHPNAPSVDPDLHVEEDDGGWEMLRICLPLDRITEAGNEEFLDFARLLSLDVDVMDYTSGRDMSCFVEEGRQRDMLYPENPRLSKFQQAEEELRAKGPRMPSRHSTRGQGTEEDPKAKVLKVPSRQSTKASGTSTPPFLSRFTSTKRAGSSSTSLASEGTLGTSPVQPSLPAQTGDPPSGLPLAADGERQDCDALEFASNVPPPKAAEDKARDAQPATPNPKTPSQGAFRGPTGDPKDLTSNASVIPPIPGAVAPGAPKAINVKLAVLASRKVFTDYFHETMRRAKESGRVYREGVVKPMPVLDVGQSSLLEMHTVEGGAGLKPEELQRSPSRRRRNRDLLRAHENGHESDLEGSSGSDDSDSDAGPGRGSGKTDSYHVRQMAKRRRAEKAKAVFGIPDDTDTWLKRCYLNRTVPFRGHIILSDRFLCFWRKTVGPVNDIKMRFEMHDVQGATVVESLHLRFNGLAVQIAGHHDLHFDFFSDKSRDETMVKINELVAAHKRRHVRKEAEAVRLEEEDEELRDEGTSLENHQQNVAVSKAMDIPLLAKSVWAKAIPDADKEAESRRRSLDLLGGLSTDVQLAIPDEAINHLPNVINGAHNKTIRPRTFALLTIGSRGDIQPYIALALGLMKDGHKVIIVTHDEFKNWVEGYGIEHRQAGGDPRALMKLSVEHKMFSPGFFKESLGNFRQWLDDLLNDAWEACHDADVLIESPSAMAGIHVAEGLGIPYLRAFTMPWTRTSAYPQAFMVPAIEMGPGFNYSTYVLFDNILWKATAGQINRWRKKKLGLASTDLSHMSQTKVPFMYNFSSAICPKPLDWHDDIAITGYWFLEDSDTDWSPPEDLHIFMKRAREDQRPLVYIGFGSIVVPNPEEMTRSIITAVDKAGVRAIIAKGWSSGEVKSDGKDVEEPPKYSENCYPLDKVPHSWLFPKVDAALHHGGAGTVGASLKAGIPTLIKPWFGDQYFWAGRVTKLGVGLRVNSLSSDDLADALEKATKDKVMLERASKVGERIRSEDGVGQAISYIYRNIHRAGKDRTQLQWQKR